MLEGEMTVCCANACTHQTGSSGRRLYLTSQEFHIDCRAPDGEWQPAFTCSEVSLVSRWDKLGSMGSVWL